MIARVWRGVTAAATHEDYVDYVETTGVADYTRTPGCHVAVILKRQLDNDSGAATSGSPASALPPPRVEVIAFSIWESEDDIRAFAGHDIDAMVLYARDEDYLLEPPTLSHHHVTFMTTPTAAAT